MPKVQAVYAFELREKKGDKPVLITLDLKNGNGQMKMGKIDGVKPDATFVMLDTILSTSARASSSHKRHSCR